MNDHSYGKHWLKSLFSISAWLPPIYGVKVPFGYLEYATAHIDTTIKSPDRREDCARRWDSVADIVRQSPRFAANKDVMGKLCDEVRLTANCIRCLRDYGQAQVPESTLRTLATSGYPLLHAIQGYESCKIPVRGSQRLLRTIFGSGYVNIDSSDEAVRQNIETLRQFHFKLLPLTRIVPLPDADTKAAPEKGRTPRP